MPGTLFDSIASVENLFLAWREFRGGKRGKPDVQQFERRLESELFRLRTELQSGRYRHGPYTPFGTVAEERERDVVW